jgi:hypothetical protein
MNSKQLSYLLSSLLALSIIAIFGVAYGANVFLGKQAKQLADAKAVNAALTTQQVQLARNKTDIQKYSDLSKVAATIVPQDKDQAEAVREIVNLASASGISQLSSITFPASTLGGATGTAPTSKGITQVTPVKGIPGVYDLQIIVTLDNTHSVPYGQFTTFLSKLEQNRRTASVSSVNIQPNTNDPNSVAFTLTLDEYIKP